MDANEKYTHLIRAGEVIAEKLKELDVIGEVVATNVTLVTHLQVTQYGLSTVASALKGLGARLIYPPVRQYVADFAGVEVDEELPAFGWPGGTTLIYLDAYNNVLCADCANVNRDDIHAGLPMEEGPAIHCEGCNRLIVASYGDPAASDEQNKADSDQADEEARVRREKAGIV